MMAFKDEAEKILPRLTCGESHPGVDVYHPGGHDNPYVERLTALHEQEMERIKDGIEPYVKSIFRSRAKTNPDMTFKEYWDGQYNQKHTYVGQSCRANGEG